MTQFGWSRNDEEAGFLELYTLSLRTLSDEAKCENYIVDIGKEKGMQIVEANYGFNIL